MQAQMTPLTLRPAAPADQDFLRQVYASTRADELALTGWDEAQRVAFLRMQFDAQDRFYRDAYRGAEFLVIEASGRPAGRLYLHRSAGEIRVMDITLLPEYRGHGIGETLLRALLAEGERGGLPVTIHVERFNPAQRLYLRLGFRLAEDKGIYWFMRWDPPAGPAALPA